ncbi:MAG: hypothetical protein IKJ55_00945 [Clostridia bacterium]|nr:hypothetical protein [Clostridia bacterium]
MDDLNKRDELATEVYPTENQENNQDYVPAQPYVAPQEPQQTNAAEEMPIEENVALQQNNETQQDYAAPEAAYQPYGEAENAYAQPYAEEPAKKSKKKVLLFSIIGGVVAIALIVVLLIFLLAPSFEDLIAEGKYTEAFEVAETTDQKNLVFDKLIEKDDYKTAYNLATNDAEKNTVINKLVEQQKYAAAYEVAEKDEQKEKIVIENILAHLSVETLDSMLDPESFVLKKAWLSSSGCLFEISGKNSFGGRISAYWRFRYEKDEKTFEFDDSYSYDLEPKEMYSWDSDLSVLQKFAYNLGLNIVRNTISTEPLDSSYADKINEMYEADKLKDIPLIDGVHTYMESL